MCTTTLAVAFGAAAHGQSEARFSGLVVDGFEGGTVPDSFGWDVALDGSWAAVVDRTDHAAATSAGSVHMYRRTDAGYAYFSTIYPSPAVPVSSIQPHTVSIRGNSLVFCRRGSIDHSVQPPAFTPPQPYVYEFDGTAWVSKTLLRPIEGPPGTSMSAFGAFGRHVAFADENTIALTSLIVRDDGNNYPAVSAVHFYHRVAGVWQEEQLWLDNGNDTLMEGSMAGGDGRIVIATQLSLQFAVFERDANGVWYRSAIVDNPRPWDLQGPEFNPMAIEGDLIAMGQPMHQNVSAPFPPHVGTVQLFRNSGGTWNYEAELEASDAWFANRASGFENDQFGAAVDIDGGRVIVGAYRAYIYPNQHQWQDRYGAAYVFEHDGASWVEKYRLWSPDPMRHDGMGNAVALEGDTALVAASRYWNTGGPGSEEGHFFYLPMGSEVCPGQDNSTGQPGRLEATGFSEIDLGFLNLRATGLPPGQMVIFLAASQTGFVANPGGSQGNLCLAGALARFNRPGEIGVSGADGRFAIRVETTDIPTNPASVLLPNATWTFQAWYRDQNPSATSNFTEAVEITFR